MKTMTEKPRTCPQCKGSGKINYTVDDGDKVIKDTMECVTCHGKKTLTTSEFKKFHAFQNMWCRCVKSPGSTYVPDTADMKHHWVCQKCGKVTQIG